MVAGVTKGVQMIRLLASCQDVRQTVRESSTKIADKEQDVPKRASRRTAGWTRGVLSSAQNTARLKKQTIENR